MLNKNNNKILKKRNFYCDAHVEVRERLTRVEEKTDNLEDNIYLIRNNDIPHLEKNINKLDSRIFKLILLNVGLLVSIIGTLLAVIFK